MSCSQSCRADGAPLAVRLDSRQRDALATLTLPDCRRMAARKARGNRQLCEELYDAAVLALARCLNVLPHVTSATPDAGPEWEDFVATKWRPYVGTAIRHAIANQARKWCAQLAERGKPIPINEDFDLPAPESTPVELSEDTRRVLPPELFDAVRLYYVEGLTLAEAGEGLGISHAQVRRRLIAAARRLVKADPDTWGRWTRACDADGTAGEFGRKINRASQREQATAST